MSKEELSRVERSNQRHTKMADYFAQSYAPKEVPKEKQQQQRHMQTDPVSFVTHYKEHGSEFYNDTELKIELSQLSGVYQDKALIYGGSKTESQFAEQQWQAAVASYHTVNQALEELNKPRETFVANVMDQFNQGGTE